jgi:uncharacterized membrane protein YfcA
MKILVFLGLGWCIGTVSGALGIGGGVLLVPALIWVCGYDYPRAAGTSITVLALPVGLLAAWKSYNENRVDLGAAVWIAGAFACGGYLGASLVKHIPAEALRLGFGFLMLYLSVRFILSASDEAVAASAGLFAVVLSSLAFLKLHRLGRKHLPRGLGEQIRARADHGRGGAEYYI